jgi:hypothetical protein
MDSNPERPTKEETAQRARALEKYARSLIDGVLTAGSGNKHDKGDCRSKTFRVEAKYRWNWDPEERGFYLDLDLQWLEGIHRHATREGQIPILALEYGNGRRFFLGPYELLTDLNVMYEDPSYTVEKGRAPRLPLFRIEGKEMLWFASIEVPQKTWGIMDPDLFQEVVANCQLAEPKAHRERREFKERLSKWKR